MNKTKGFSLIEFIVVVAIISVMVAVGIAGLDSMGKHTSIEKVNDESRMNKTRQEIGNVMTYEWTPEFNSEYRCIVTNIGGVSCYPVLEGKE